MADDLEAAIAQNKKLISEVQQVGAKVTAMLIGLRTYQTVLESLKATKEEKKIKAFVDKLNKIQFQRELEGMAKVASRMPSVGKLVGKSVDQALKKKLKK